MENKRILIAGVVFVALLGIAFFAIKSRNERISGDDPESVETPEIPAIDEESVVALEITRPASDDEEAVTVRLERDGDVWHVTSPVEAEADQNAVRTALEKLSELEVTGVAATNSDNHDRLEVSEAKGIRVVVHGAEGEVANMFVGAYRGRSTMVRLEGSDVVATVAGSIKYAFNKELKDWRNRRVVDEEPSRVRQIHFASANGEFRFARNAEDEWEQRPVGEEEPEPIERFGSSKVQSIVSSVARMRATSFAEAGVDAASAGLTEPSGTLTLFLASEDEEAAPEPEGEEPESGEPEGETADTAAPPAPMERIVLRVGGEVEGEREFYVQREGNPTIYVVSQYLADRMRPDAEKFQTPEEGEEPAMAPTPMLGGPGGPGGQQIPPEVLQQIQAQLGMQAG